MPDDRMLHRCQGHSAKLAQCDHLTYRVWTQYLLSADDFGVMPAAAAMIRGDNFALMQEAEAEIQRALDTLQQVGLVAGFDHQGQRFLCSLEWQDYQRIRWPRTTYYPSPSAEVLRECSDSTRKLFSKHPSKLSPRKGSKVAVSHRLTANGFSTSEGVQGEGQETGLTPTVLGQLWNVAVEGRLPTVTSLSGTRRKHAAARIAEHPDPKWWRAYFDRIVASDFLCGRTPRKAGHEDWRPTFDWAINPTNLDKVVDGNYDNAKPSKPAKRENHIYTCPECGEMHCGPDSGTHMDGVMYQCRHCGQTHQGPDENVCMKGKAA
jgi:predicted RNA-binding Zn-ribbon protein involved in translation (DUF1610 family)